MQDLCSRSVLYGVDPMSAQDQVETFHRAFGVAIDQQLTPELVALRCLLISEEAREAQQALEGGSLADIAQELADLAYVTYGTAVSLGIDLDAAVVEVHRANMSKLGADGKPIYRSDGKVLKGPDYRPPDMTAALGRHAG
jgi:predicted HAD superfamily Cof-like phosphohydrolase